MIDTPTSSAPIDGPFTLDRFDDGTAAVRCRGVVVAPRARIWRNDGRWGTSLTVNPGTVVEWIREGRIVVAD
jgi:predicted metallopeptidase